MLGILEPDVPLTFWYSEREEHNPQGNPTTVAAPSDNSEKFYDLNVAWQDASFLDPVKFSSFYAEGNKIHPWAQQQIVSNLALGSNNSNSDGEFKIGKLLGYLKASMHQGGQRPVDIRGNLQEATPTTYGSMYEVSPLVTTPGPAFSAAGFDLSGIDGYPY